MRGQPSRQLYSVSSRSGHRTAQGPVAHEMGVIGLGGTGWNRCHGEQSFRRSRLYVWRWERLLVSRCGQAVFLLWSVREVGVQ